MRAFGWFVMLAGSLCGARLPVRTFAVADGMPRDVAFCIVPDSRGFLWICTNEGLSWFDGYRFRNYGVEQGLAHRVVTNVLETSGGTLLVGTDGGLSRMGAGGFKRIASETPSPDQISDLVQDRQGVVWGAGFNGIFRLDRPDDEKARLRFIKIAQSDDMGVTSLAADPDGTLWIGTGKGLARRRVDGGIDWPAGLPMDGIKALLLDREHRLWVGTLNGLWRLDTRSMRVERRFGKSDGLVSARIHRLYQSREGTVWVGTALSLSERWIDAGGRESFRNYSTPEGLLGRRVTAIGEDAGGNLWVGMDQGLTRVSRSGFVVYGEKEGIGDLAVASVVAQPGQGMVAISNQTNRLVLHALEQDRFRAVTPFFPPSVKYFGWGWDQMALVDREGAWWIATGEGVLRYPKVARLEMLAHAQPKLYNMRTAGLPGEDIFRLFEDSRGDVWISAVERAPVRWRRAEDRFETFSASSFQGTVSAFAEDRAGDVWMGLSNEPGTGNPTGLVRYRGGRVERFLEDGKDEGKKSPGGMAPGGMSPGGMSPGWIGSLLIDHLGRLWIGTGERGLELVADPASEHPKIERFPARLSSVSVRCLAEDRQGRIWAGTGTGLDRVDPSTGEIRYFNAAQGYPGGGCSALRVEADGTLWAGSSVGLARFVTGGETQGPPPVYITGVSVEGKTRGSAQLFPVDFRLGKLAPEENQIRLEFASPAAVEGRAVRYEYALERSGRVLKLITDQRTIEYPGLAPGKYDFQVSAVDERGRSSSVPARIAFEILPPVWARWWFLAMVAAALAAAIHAIFRFQLSKKLELERLRTRIAQDLHDDLGTSLSRMAIMSETVRLEMDRHPDKSREQLSEIAAAARNMVDGMGDLVWSISPRKDDMRSLLRRVREFASGALEADGIDWTLAVQPAVEELALDAEQRRHLYLILKEAITNAAKHARCSSVRIDLHVSGSRLEASIADNGGGLREASPGDGNGLRNMRRRAEGLRGTLSIESGAGTRVVLVFPIHAGSLHRPLA